MVAYPIFMVPEKLQPSGTRLFPSKVTFCKPLEKPEIETLSFVSEKFKKRYSIFFINAFMIVDFDSTQT